MGLQPTLQLNMDEPLRSEVLSLLQQSRRLEAVSLMRRQLGLELRAACDALGELEAEILSHPKEAEADIEILAVGPFSADVLSLMDYAPHFYSGLAEGSPVILSVGVAYTRGQAMALVGALGVDPFGPGGCEIPPDHLSPGSLAIVLEEDEVHAIQILRSKAFRFYLHQARPDRF